MPHRFRAVLGKGLESRVLFPCSATKRVNERMKESLEVEWFVEWDYSKYDEDNEDDDDDGDHDNDATKYPILNHCLWRESPTAEASFLLLNVLCKLVRNLGRTALRENREEAFEVPKRMEGQESTRGVWWLQLVRLEEAQGKAEERTAEWPGETRRGKTDVSEWNFVHFPLSHVM